MTCFSGAVVSVLEVLSVFSLQNNLWLWVGEVLHPILIVNIFKRVYVLYKSCKVNGITLSQPLIYYIAL